MTPFRKSVAREYFESIIVAVVLALFIRTFIVQAFKIPTGSMEQNLLIGDHLLVNKFVFGPARTGLEQTILPMRDIRRGDVIVFKYPEEPDRDFIKRVVGLPGERIQVRDKRVFVNDAPLDEPYVYFLEPPAVASENAEITSFGVRDWFGPVTVPAGHYFVMGDNRDNSEDSRYWGFLPRENVKGRALMVYWSYASERADFEEDGLGATLRNLASVAAHFFTRTRWERLFHLIR
jgi:signal peptidase I